MNQVTPETCTILNPKCFLWWPLNIKNFCITLVLKFLCHIKDCIGDSGNIITDDNAMMSTWQGHNVESWTLRGYNCDSKHWDQDKKTIQCNRSKGGGLALEYFSHKLTYVTCKKCTTEKSHDSLKNLHDEELKRQTCAFISISECANNSI